MLEVKVLEIRDRMTMISAIAVNMDPTTPTEAIERLHLLRSGYGQGYPTILLTYTDGQGKVSNDPYGWNTGARTMPEAHKYITENWKGLQSGDVVDVEFILGESLEVKQSEFMGTKPVRM